MASNPDRRGIKRRVDDREVGNLPSEEKDEEVSSEDEDNDLDHLSSNKKDSSSSSDELCSSSSEDDEDDQDDTRQQRGGILSSGPPPPKISRPSSINNIMVRSGGPLLCRLSGFYMNLSSNTSYSVRHTYNETSTTITVGNATLHDFVQTGNGRVRFNSNDNSLDIIHTGDGRVSCKINGRNVEIVGDDNVRIQLD